uniref:protein-tyrosine-phosphatase n=1 Tax=Ceratitis capitata TaxID=7213 RepID=W8B5V4_CERCA
MVTVRPSTQTEIIEFAGMRFLITDTPNEVTIMRYVQNLQRCNVSLLVGICEVHYDTEPFKAADINVKSLNFAEGTDPDERLKKQWFRILHENMTENPDTCVAVHCNSGLGRAAVLVAIALIELGMSYDVAVAVIRSKRRGAINNAQYEYLRQYQPELNLVQRKTGSSSSCALQ